MEKMKQKNTKRLILLTVLLCFSAVTVLGTFAYIITSTGALTNIFVPGKVDDEIVETFENNIKSDIQVKNTGNVDAFVRVNLVAYWQDAEGNVTGISAAVPEFTLGSGWAKGSDGFYYYKSAVKPNELTTDLLADGQTIVLTGDENGNKMVVEVLAQAIQAEPISAVADAWGVNPASLQ